MTTKSLKQSIDLRGGFVNAHSHLDRANTAQYFSKDEKYQHLKDKWLLVDKIKKMSLYSDYKDRINLALDEQKRMGTSLICSFVDIDSVVSTKAIIAASEIAREREDIKLIIACQTLKGVLDETSKMLILNSIHRIDVIGSLPGADKGRESEHLDIVMNWSKKYNKRLHVHVDQLNNPEEKETELLARKTIEHGLEGKVSAVHSISLACHPKKYRKEVYNICKDANLSFIACPSAWIDHPRSEVLMPFHNAITPVDELLEFGFTVAIGSDNIQDVYKPYCNGDMFFELRMLLEACKIYDEDVLVDISTKNGKTVLGVE
jgi:cytosine deaminase